MNVAGPIFVGSILMSVSMILAIGKVKLNSVLSYIDQKSDKTDSMLFNSEGKSASQL
jgi:hypothetical protein